MIYILNLEYYDYDDVQIRSLVSSQDKKLLDSISEELNKFISKMYKCKKEISENYKKLENKPYIYDYLKEKRLESFNNNISEDLLKILDLESDDFKLMFFEEGNYESLVLEVKDISEI